MNDHVIDIANRIKFLREDAGMSVTELISKLYQKMTEEEYRQEWLKGLHHTDYNNCRFAEDKTQYAIEWTKKNVPNVNLENQQN